MICRWQRRQEHRQRKIFKRAAVGLCSLSRSSGAGKKVVTWIWQVSLTSRICSKAVGREVENRGYGVPKKGAGNGLATSWQRVGVLAWPLKKTIRTHYSGYLYFRSFLSKSLLFGHYSGYHQEQGAKKSLFVQFVQNSGYHQEQGAAGKA